LRLCHHRGLLRTRPIGAAIVKQVVARPGFKVVGAIDIDPAKMGRDLAEWSACRSGSASGFLAMPARH